MNSTNNLATFTLPTDWAKWCKEANLTIEDDNGFYLKGRGYRWRVNCFGEFELGDTYEDFDRWSLCKIDSVPQYPKTEKEFLFDVSRLLASRMLRNENEDLGSNKCHELRA